MKSHVVIESTRLLTWCQAVKNAVHRFRERQFLAAANEKIRSRRRFLFWTLKEVTEQEALASAKQHRKGGLFACDHCNINFFGAHILNVASQLETAAHCSQSVVVSIEDAHDMRRWTPKEEFEVAFIRSIYR